MYDLHGVSQLLLAYPVHLLTFLGCILLLVLVWPKRKRKGKHIPISSESVAKMKEFTKNEKDLLVGKINENRMSGLRKSTVIGQNFKFMVFVTIVLSALAFIYLAVTFIDGFK